jgi:hypothetical protein
VDGGQYWSTRPGDPWATGADQALASCQFKAGSSKQAIEPPFSKKFLVNPPNLKNWRFATAFSYVIFQNILIKN